MPLGGVARNKYRRAKQRDHYGGRIDNLLEAVNGILVLRILTPVLCKLLSFPPYL